MMSSSVHLRVERFFTNGSNWATSIAGRFADGAFATRFCKVDLIIVSSASSPLTLNVAMITRMTFSLTAAFAMSVRRGIISYFLDEMSLHEAEKV